jgi:hypothetical protein
MMSLTSMIDRICGGMAWTGIAAMRAPQNTRSFASWLKAARTRRSTPSDGRIGNLSNRLTYEWEEAEVRKVLKDAVAEVEARFASPKGKASAKFAL